MMSETEQNPFKTASPEVMAVVERLLIDLWKSGEWQSEHDALVDQWRDARWEAGMGPWVWWAASDGGDDCFTVEASTREQVIADARREFPTEQLIIVEARSWDDRLKEGDDYSPFAMMRNREILCGAEVTA